MGIDKEVEKLGIDIVQEVQDLPKRDVKVEPIPYEGAKRVCHVCGKNLGKGEEIICRNCSGSRPSEF